MFINISTSSDKEEKDRFSYLLCKHPDNLFKREHGPSMVYGWYSENVEYNAVIVNSDVDFIDRMKQLNSFAYLSYQKDGATPNQLNIMLNMLRSAVTETGYTEEVKKFNTEFKELSCVIGSFKYNEKMISLFKAFDFDVRERVETSIVDGSPVSGTLHLYKNNIKLSKFLQQIFVIAFASTFEYDFYGKLEPSRLDKFIRLSEAWFSECKDKNELKWLLRILTNNDKGRMKTWIAAADMTEEDGDTLKKSLYVDHVRLHDQLFDEVKALLEPVIKDDAVIVDYGAGNSKFSNVMRKMNDKSSIYAVDAKFRTSKNWHGVKEYQMNLLYPDMTILPYAEKLDILVLMEVIEHFNKEDRVKLLDIICNVFQPKEIVITTPNGAFNKYYGMEEGKFRHPDHKVEYDYDLLKSEIVDYVTSHGYPSISVTGVEDKNIVEKEKIEGMNSLSTFIVHAVRDLDRGYDHKCVSKYNTYYDSIYLPISNYFSDSKELGNGYASKQFKYNVTNAIPFVQPTMAPVEYHINDTILENPAAAVEYYQKRGITDLVYEPKMMGSNAQVIIFKNEEVARYFGLDKCIYVNSRNGFPYFKNDEKGLADIKMLYDEMRPNMEYDYYVLNGEMLPWAYKGKGLIKDQFELPLQATSINNKFIIDSVTTKFVELVELFNTAMKNEDNVDRASEVLSWFAKDGETTYHIFDLLACGHVPSAESKKGSFVDGFYVNHELKHMYLHDFNSDHVKVVWTKKVMDVMNLVKEWEHDCENGLEGYVIKPRDKYVHSRDGYLIQPCTKVRGKDYLRIIYGENYLNDDVFEKVIKRSIKRKRIQAIQQWEISHSILRTWLNRNDIEHKRYLAFFIGNEGINMRNIDATL